MHNNLLTPVSHMEVGCPGTWGLELLTPNPDSSPGTRLPYPAPAAITQSQELCGNNNSNHIYNKILDRDWFSARLFVT